MLDFFQKIISFFNEKVIDYMLSGSVALSVYTLPRATRDFDFIVHFKSEDIDFMIDYFKDGCYCDEDSIKDAIKRKGMFNIIDYASGFKADFVILKDEDFRQTEFKRRKKIELYDIPVYIVSPEDLLISKLVWIQDSQSNIQMEDIKSLNALDNIDRNYIIEWVQKLKLNTFDLLND